VKDRLKDFSKPATLMSVQQALLDSVYNNAKRSQLNTKIFMTVSFASFILCIIAVFTCICIAF